MIYIELPNNQNRLLSFYLAMEEFVARQLTNENECFFMWQVEPSVIFGRNQLIENEVNIDYCKTHGINMFRRKSGGGCVYADMNNIMFSYITSADIVAFTFYKYINRIILALNKLGINAKASSRNDILIDGRKVSGNAFYHLYKRSIVHGTMLFDTDMNNMIGAITPNSDKLESKGVNSVRQHITLLKDYINMDIEELKHFFRHELCQDTYILNDYDVECINTIEKEYLSDKFIFGNNPKYTKVTRRRFEGVGEIELRCEIKNKILKDVNLMGDFFVVGDLNDLVNKLKGIKLNHKDLSEAIPDKLSDYILNLTKDDFISLFL